MWRKNCTCKPTILLKASSPTEYNHPLMTLIVKDAHEKVQHNGVRETLTESPV